MDNLFMQGVDLMLLGMGFVFVFLILLVFLMSFMSFIINRFLPEPVPVVQPKKSKTLPKNNNNSNEELLVALTAASIHHKKTNM